MNDWLETNLDNLYAVGDAIEVTDFINGQKTAIPLAVLPTNKTGLLLIMFADVEQLIKVHKELPLLWYLD